MSAKRVFISYNHEDSAVADKLKSALEEKGVVVTIDRVDMTAGASIQEFIETSIRNADVTLSIVSNRSLLSAWVALESITAFYSEKLRDGKKFIACYIDDDFFKPDFRLNATGQIDAKIDEIEKLSSEHAKENIDTVDLDSQKTRLYKLRNELGDILLKLKDSLTLDIREAAFERSLARILESIKALSVAEEVKTHQPERVERVRDELVSKEILGILKLIIAVFLSIVAISALAMILCIVVPALSKGIDLKLALSGLGGISALLSCCLMLTINKVLAVSNKVVAASRVM